MGMAGVVVIFLSHVRSSLVMVAGCAVVYSIILVGQGRLRTAFTLALLMAVCGFYSLLYAESLGGQSIIDRFATLVEDDPSKVYEKSARMGMVVGAFDTLLVEHPLGAGLGRWGMMRIYFGNENNYDSPSIWAEVQFQAWVLDGGIVLLSLYLIALAVAVQRVVRMCLFHQSSKLRQWAAVIVMLSAGPDSPPVQLLSVPFPNGHAVLVLDRGLRRPGTRRGETSCSRGSRRDRHPFEP